MNNFRSKHSRSYQFNIQSIKTDVTIIEDSKEYQQALAYWINESDRFRVAEIYASAEEALPFAGQLTGIVIVDIQLPKMNGAELVKHICEQNKKVQCIICSMYDDDAFVFSALKNGALGYLLKDSTSDQILAALEDLQNGGSPMSPYIARKVIGSFQHKLFATSASLAQHHISDREREVLESISKGLIYKEIGEKLYISTETVRKHVRNIYQKLHVQNKIEALNKFRNG